MAAVATGSHNIRYLADAPSNTYQDVRHAIVQQGRPLVYLALSGGGGAYGAGILNGWTQSGSRPEFTMVSGVSTGALIAPFAFLGPADDDRLRQIYTSGEAESFIGLPNLLGPIFGAGLFDSGRLRQLVEHYLDDDILYAIGREDKKGRRLAVVTTDLDAQRAVIWDMGAIAATGGPKAFKLFRDVIAASASVPVVFAGSGEVVAFDLTDKDVDDASHVAPLLDQLASAPVSFMGDGAYDRGCVLEGVLARNPKAKFIVSPCKGAVTRPTVTTSPTQRDRHVCVVDADGRMNWQ